MDFDSSIELDVLALFAVLEGCLCGSPANLARLGGIQRSLAQIRPDR
jgi:hypothetical protein